MGFVLRDRSLMLLDGVAQGAGAAEMRDVTDISDTVHLPQEGAAEHPNSGVSPPLAEEPSQHPLKPAGYVGSRVFLQLERQALRQEPVHEPLIPRAEIGSTAATLRGHVYVRLK